jgi:hypothetical protein
LNEGADASFRQFSLSFLPQFVKRANNSGQKTTGMDSGDRVVPALINFDWLGPKLFVIGGNL